MKKLDVLAAVLVVIGALNWGLAGRFTSIWWPPFSACDSVRPLL